MPIQLFDLTPTQSSGSMLGQALGQGIGQRIAQQRQQQQQSQLAKMLFGQQGEEFSALPLEAQLKAAQLQQAQQKSSQNQLQQQRESQLLSKYRKGEELSSEEEAELSPVSQRAIMSQQKPAFEPTEERLEAERVSNLATELENEHKVYQAEEQRLGRMEELSKKGELSTPLMVTALNKLGLPLGVLGNPDSEEYAKLEADFLRDVSKVFPGGRVTNYEIQAYLKTIPSLLNTPEGKKAILRNKRLQNEAREVRYKAYKDILKENKGKKPRNMALEIDERVGPKLAEIEDEFRSSINNEIEKFQQPIRLVGPNGNKFDIPPHLLEKALKEGFKFQ